MVASTMMAKRPAFGRVYDRPCVQCSGGESRPRIITAQEVLERGNRPILASEYDVALARLQPDLSTTAGFPKDSKTF